MRHDSSTCNKTHSYVTWLIHMQQNSSTCDIIQQLECDSSIRNMTHSAVTWLIRMWHDCDSFVHDETREYVTWLIIGDVTHSCVTWSLDVWYVCDVCDVCVCLCVWESLCLCVRELCVICVCVCILILNWPGNTEVFFLSLWLSMLIYECVLPHTWRSHVTYMKERHHTHT